MDSVKELLKERWRITLNKHFCFVLFSINTPRGEDRGKTVPLMASVRMDQSWSQELVDLSLSKNLSCLRAKRNGIWLPVSKGPFRNMGAINVKPTLRRAGRSDGLSQKKNMLHRLTTTLPRHFPKLLTWSFLLDDMLRASFLI